MVSCWLMVVNIPRRRRDVLSNQDERAADVNLWVTNLTDTEYYTSATPLGNVLGFSGYYGQPRFYGFDVKYHF